MLLLNHTAAQSDDKVWILFLLTFKFSYIAKNTILRIFPDRTGIKKDQVRKGGFFCKSIPHLRKHSSDLLTVRLILLAAKGPYTRHRRMVKALFQ